MEPVMESIKEMNNKKLQSQLTSLMLKIYGNHEYSSYWNKMYEYLDKNMKPRYFLYDLLFVKMTRINETK